MSVMKSLSMTGLKFCHRPKRMSSAFRSRSLFSTGIYRSKIAREFGNYEVGLTRMIDPSLATNAIRLAHSNIDMDVAFEQHKSLVEAMRSAGVQIFELPSDGLADSVFIEDTIVIADLVAMVTHPGAISRRAKTERVKAVLESSFGSMLNIVYQTEGNLDGGDVLFTGLEHP